MADRHLVEPRTCRSGSSNRASLQLFRVLHLKGALFFALFQFQKKVTTALRRDRHESGWGYPVPGFSGGYFCSGAVVWMLAVVCGFSIFVED